MIVDHSKLVELLEVCPMCSSHSAVELKDQQGGYQLYGTTCLTCNYTRTWENSRKLSRTPLINVMLSAGILFNGALPTQFLRVLQLLNIKAPVLSTFYHYQKTHLHAVSKV